MIIILAVVTAASITALFVRGFRIEDLTDQLSSQTLQTPTMEVWLVQTTDYDEKMDAYKAGITESSNGFGVYVLSENTKWTWVAGVYPTQVEADSVLQQSQLPANASTKLYQIAGKSFQLVADAITPCREVLAAVQTVFDLLLRLRTAIQDAGDINNLLLDLTTQYNQIKSSAKTLQGLNAGLQNQLIATMIYTANQNILSLQDIVCGDTGKSCGLATVNTALLTTIFSLDNF